MSAIRQFPNIMDNELAELKAWLTDEKILKVVNDPEKFRVFLDLCDIKSLDAEPTKSASELWRQVEGEWADYDFASLPATMAMNNLNWIYKGIGLHPASKGDWEPIESPSRAVNPSPNRLEVWPDSKQNKRCFTTDQKTCLLGQTTTMALLFIDVACLALSTDATARHAACLRSVFKKQAGGMWIKRKSRAEQEEELRVDYDYEKFKETFDKVMEKRRNN
jgi:hypothetical protein